MDALFERGVTIVDGTGAWGPSVAELTLSLALNGLRRVADWHRRMAAGEPLWKYKFGQYCDPPEFVNRTLGDKTVGVMGLGQIDGRVAMGRPIFRTGKQRLRLIVGKKIRME